MANTRLNVLVYSGPGSTIESVRHCLYSLRRLLSPHFAVHTITGETIIKEPWASSCALLVFPGGADLGYCRTLNGEGNRRIKQYVTMGGSYLGLCAGGYYASSRCEFEIGNERMEVVGDRELEFYPGVCRGSAFPGFVYNSESGTHAAKLNIEKEPFAAVGGVLPQVFRSYANGGGVFVDAEKYKHKGVQILAVYTDALEVSSGETAAAAVYCRVGQGAALLTGTHPEYASINLQTPARGMRSAVYDALIEDEKSRTLFFKACLRKLDLKVNEDEQAVPSLSVIHLSSANSRAATELWSSMKADVTSDNGREYLKGEHDVFQFETAASTWSISSLTKAASEKLSISFSDKADTPDDENDGTSDLDKAVKKIVIHEDTAPSPKETPYFNHAAYFANLNAYAASATESTPDHRQLGSILIYGEVVTSTSTLLEKNPTLTRHLPSGTAFCATTQLSGRGRGSNIWISPAGSLMFSFILTHPLSLNATAPVVFIQYLAALAVVEGVQTYDATSSQHSAYRNLPVKLKWPNDIYALDPAKRSANPADPTSYAKIGGVLVNSSYSGGDYTLITGIGINVLNAAPTTSLGAVLDAFNTSLTSNNKAALPTFTLEKLMARVLTTFEKLYAIFRRRGFAGELEELYYRHWLHKDQVVVLETEGGSKARIKGVTHDWGLLLAEEVVGEKGRERVTGKTFALQSDSNSFDFFKGLVKRKL